MAVLSAVGGIKLATSAMTDGTLTCHMNFRLPNHIYIYIKGLNSVYIK